MESADRRIELFKAAEIFIGRRVYFHVVPITEILAIPGSYRRSLCGVRLRCFRTNGRRGITVGAEGYTAIAAGRDEPRSLPDNAVEKKTALRGDQVRAAAVENPPGKRKGGGGSRQRRLVTGTTHSGNGKTYENSGFMRTCGRRARARARAWKEEGGKEGGRRRESPDGRPRRCRSLLTNRPEVNVPIAFPRIAFPPKRIPFAMPRFSGREKKSNSPSVRCSSCFPWKVRVHLALTELESLSFPQILGTSISDTTWISNFFALSDAK